MEWKFTLKKTTSSTSSKRPTNDLGTYLGYPLKPSYKTNGFNFVLDKLNRKLQGWKTNLLSRAGRIPPINSTTSNMTNHIMKALMLPKTILYQIDKINRNFFWGYSLEP